jgi:type I restriction enzyme R subunit
MITEDQLERLCLDWFQAIGYSYANGYDIAPDAEHPERVDYRQIVLFDRLLSQLQKINPHIPLEVLERVSQQIAQAGIAGVNQKQPCVSSFVIRRCKG